MKTVPFILAALLVLAGCNNYSVVLLGDTHFDTYPVDTYHSDYDEPVEWLNNVQRAEFERNARMWADRCERLIDNASALVRSDTEMILQMGDLIQGDCGQASVHRQMLSDVMAHFKGRFPSGLPFVTVAGNHDVRGNYNEDGTYNQWGKGAEKVYDEYMPRRMSEELGIDVPGTTFTCWVGRDVFIFVDFNTPDDAAIEQALESSRRARNTFVVCHAPVFPYNSGSVRWFFHGWDNPDDTAARLRFRELFAQRNVIWLCGHTHTTEFADWYGDGGRITQMTMNSVWSSDELGEYVEVCSSPEDYGAVESAAALYAEYIPGLVSYSVSPAAGSYRMNVRGRHVIVDFFAGDSKEVSKTFVLR